jgi:hypothetical protein
MLLAYLREGEDSDAWKRSVKVAERLVWSVMPKHVDTDRQVLLKAIPELLNQLRDGLAQISYDQHRVSKLFKELQVCHIKSLRSTVDPEDVESMPDPLSESTSSLLDADSTQVIDQESTQLVDQDSLSDDGDKQREMGSLSQSQDDEFICRARALEVGSWLEWEVDEGKRIRAKLTWKSEVTGTYVFVNRKGGKVGEMTLVGLAALFRADKVQVIEEMGVPLMDRALNAMLEALNRGKQGAPATS